MMKMAIAFTGRHNPMKNPRRLSPRPNLGNSQLLDAHQDIAP